MFLEMFGEKKQIEEKKTEDDIIDQICDGAPKEIREQVEAALLFYSQPNNPEKNITDEIKSSKLRDAFNSMLNYIIDNRLNTLNNAQRLFLNTGCIASKIKIKDTTIELLRSDVYEKLKKQFLSLNTLPSWGDVFMTQEDLFKAIAKGEITPLDLDRPPHTKKTKKEQDAENYRDITDKRQAEIKQLKEIFENIEKLIIDFLANTRTELTRDMKVKFDTLKTYFNIIQQQILSPQQIQMKQDLEKKIIGMGSDLSKFFATVEEISSSLKVSTQTIDDKIGKIRELTHQLSIMEGKPTSQSKRNDYVFFDSEKIKLIKKDLLTLTSIIVKGSDTASNRIPYSASRILINAHTEKVENPVEECYCTPENLMKSFLKISKIHTNCFLKDLSGNLILPPIIIVPGRNYVEWFDDRFIVSFVSGEVGRKGPNYSFSPVDMQTLRMFGLYLAKDPIYNYRGEQNIGTFMGDYAGKVEKKAQVKWVGEEKKMTVVSSAKVVDAAGREEAVRDYIDVIYNLSNGFQPPHKLSIRKLGIILSYVVILNEENTVSLVLKYIAPSQPPSEVREIILSIAKKKKDEARKLVENVFKKDAQIAKAYQNNIKILIDKVFGKDFF